MSANLSRGEGTNRRAALLRIGAGSALGLTAGWPAVVAAQAANPVTVGIVNSSSDAPFFIAERLGYYRDAGLAVTTVSFSGAPQMIAPLGVGQLDVGSGGPSAGLYNAIGRKIDLRMVADKARPSRGNGYGPLMIRKDLVASGKYKSPRDLKGMTFALAGAGSTASASIARLLQSAGLRSDDLHYVQLGYPEQIAALANGSIDAAMLLEPNATVAERRGVAIRVAGNDTWYPDQEQAVVMYGSALLGARRDVGERFMSAYVRAVRYYDGALVGGRLRGRNAKQVIDILVETTDVKDRSIYADMISQSVDPDGKMNVRSLADDLAFYADSGLISTPVTVAESIDPSFAAAAARALGPYRPG